MPPAARDWWPTASGDRLPVAGRTHGTHRLRVASMVSARGLRFHLLRSRPVADSVPLVCINGGLIYDHGSMWPTMRRLAKHRQVIVYDQRGRGKSEPPPALRAARIEHDAGDLAAIREALGIPVWDVLGHSWGSAIAMLGTLGDPAGVRRL